jgi:predicted small lipoprotein YifL
MTRIPMFPLILLTLALFGCGNKGPLVHPPPPEEAPEAPTPATSDAGAEADPLPADQTDDASVPVEPVPAETEPATPPDDTTDDDPPGG